MIIMATSLINALALYRNAKHGDECVPKSGMSSCHFSSLLYPIKDPSSNQPLLSPT